MCLCGLRWDCPIIPCIPLGEGAEALAEGGGGAEAEVLFQGGCVGEGRGDVAGLHGDELLMGLEVVVGGKDACPDELFLEDADEVEQVLGGTVSDVVDLVGRDGQAVLACLDFRCVLHDADYAFDDIVDVCEVALAVAVVEDLYGFASAELVGEAEVSHVGPSGRAVDGEEAQAGGGDGVEFAVGVCEEFVAFLGGCVEADGVVHLVVGGVGDFLV